MKKIALLLAVLMIGFLFPCAWGEENDGCPVLEMGDYFPLSEKITLTAWVVNTVGQTSVSNSYVLDWISEKANIDLQVTKEFSGKGASDQLDFLLATTTDLPDILLCTRWTKAECALYGQQGLVIPLDEYLSSCQNWNRLTDICGEAHATDLQMPDGHIYCFGSVNECFHLIHQARMWVYKPWIDLLCGGRLPETTEEFYQYLRKVAQMDPNGNGLSDEIPLMGQIDEGWANDPFTFLSNSFVHNNTIYGSTNATIGIAGAYVENGLVKFNWVEEAYRQALRYMNRLYAGGLLYSQTYTQNGYQFQARLEAEPHLVGAVASGFIPDTFSIQLAEDWSEWACLPPLAGPDGTRLSYQSSYDYFYNCNGLVTNACQYPEVAVQLFDLLASAEGTLVQNYGREHYEWDWCDGTEGKGLDGKAPLYQFHFSGSLIQTDETGKALKWPSDVLIGSLFDAFRNASLVEEGIFNGEKELWDFAVQYDAYSPGPDTVYPNIAYTADQSQEILRYQETIGRYVEQAAVRFIVGGMNLDADWTAYLTLLNSMGQQDYQRLLQEAYDSYIKK